MGVVRLLVIALIASTVVVVAFSASADLLEWKKLKFETVGQELPVAQSMEELRSLFADPLVCSGCHPRQYEAWSKSFHAGSIRNAGFQALYLKYLEYLKLEETKKTLGRAATAEDLRQCLFCHAPLVQFASDGLVLKISDAIAAGNWDEIRGVQIGCVMCHAVNPQGKWVTGSFKGSGTLYGPVSDPVSQAMHKSRYSPLHTRSEFCGICHSLKTFNVFCSLVYEQQKESGAEGRVSCQDCHMKGKSNVPVAIAGKKKRTLHDHTFPGGRFNAMWGEAVDMGLLVERRKSGDVLVTVNLASKITHNIPDG